MTSWSTWRALLAVGLIACGDEATTEADADAVDLDTSEIVEDADGDTAGALDTAVAVDTSGPAVVYGTPCGDAERVGRFEVGQWGFYAAVTGAVADGVVPLTVLQEVDRDGDCALLQKRTPFCDPACGGSDLCDHDGRCVPYPTNLDAGTVTVDGLLAPVTMTPNAVSTYSETAVPMPLFEAGAPVTLSATGGDDVPPLALSAYGVPDLSVPDTVVEVMRGQPLTLSWDAAPGAWRVQLTLGVDQHGTSPLTLRCVVDDIGSYTLGADLVTALLDGGVTGYATYDLSRRTVDRADASDGCVELDVFSYASGKLVVAGHTPCNGPADCDAPQTCDLPTQTCVDP